MTRRLATRLAVALMPLFLLAGCATQQRYEASLQQWVGQPVTAVMDVWGYPTGSFPDPVSGNTVYVWDRQTVAYSPPTYQTTIIGGRGYSSAYATTFGFGGQSYTLRCQTYFEVDAKKVIQRWRIQGNDCRL